MQPRKLQLQEQFSTDLTDKMDDTLVKEVETRCIKQKEINNVKDEKSNDNQMQLEAEDTVSSSLEEIPVPKNANLKTNNVEKYSEDILQNFDGTYTPAQDKPDPTIAEKSANLRGEDDKSASSEYYESPSSHTELDTPSGLKNYGNKTHQSFDVTYDDANNSKYIQSVIKDEKVNTLLDTENDRTDVADCSSDDNNDHTSDLKDKPQKGEDLKKTKNLKIKISTTIDQETPTTIAETIITQKEEESAEVKVTETTDSIIDMHFEKKASCSFGKFECIMSVILIFGIGCIAFGLYELSINPSSIAGWLLVSIPTISFICFLAIRCYLKKQKGIGSDENHNEQVDNRSQGSMHPVVLSQETDITAQNIMK